ncbi:MAG: hypothetical protein EHM35_18845, partial [Planctomycetaceae bacterium]
MPTCAVSSQAPNRAKSRHSARLREPAPQVTAASQAFIPVAAGIVVGSVVFCLPAAGCLASGPRIRTPCDRQLANAGLVLRASVRDDKAAGGAKALEEGLGVVGRVPGERAGEEGVDSYHQGLVEGRQARQSLQFAHCGEHARAGTDDIETRIGKEALE